MLTPASRAALAMVNAGISEPSSPLCRVRSMVQSQGSDGAKGFRGEGVPKGVSGLAVHRRLHTADQPAKIRSKDRRSSKTLSWVQKHTGKGAGCTGGAKNRGTPSGQRPGDAGAQNRTPPSANESPLQSRRLYRPGPDWRRPRTTAIEFWNAC